MPNFRFQMLLSKFDDSHTWCAFSFSDFPRIRETPRILSTHFCVKCFQVAYYGPIANLRSSLSNLGFACPEGTPLPEVLLDLLEMPADESVRPAHSEKLEKLKKLSEPSINKGSNSTVYRQFCSSKLLNQFNEGKKDTQCRSLNHQRGCIY